VNVSTMRTEASTSVITATLAQGETAPAVGASVVVEGAADATGTVVAVADNTITIAANVRLAELVRDGARVIVEV
jgi:hypothetical protein